MSHPKWWEDVRLFIVLLEILSFELGGLPISSVYGILIIIEFIWLWILVKSVRFCHFSLEMYFEKIQEKNNTPTFSEYTLYFIVHLFFLQNWKLSVISSSFSLRNTLFTENSKKKFVCKVAQYGDFIIFCL